MELNIFNLKMLICELLAYAVIKIVRKMNANHLRICFSHSTYGIVVKQFAK